MDETIRTPYKVKLSDGKVTTTFTAWAESLEVAEAKALEFFGEGWYIVP